MADLQRALEWAKNNPQDERSKKLLEQVASGKLNTDMVQAKSIQQTHAVNEPGGVMGGISKGIESVKNAFTQTTDANADVLNSGQSYGSQVAQTTGNVLKGFGDAAMGVASGVVSAVTPDVIEKPVVDIASNLMQKGVTAVAGNEKVQQALESWNMFKQTNPEAAANIEAAGDVTSFFANALGAGKGAEIAGKGVLKAGEKTLETAGKGIAKTGELVGKAGEFGAAQTFGLKTDTVRNIIKNPELFTKSEMDKITRESVFNKVKTSVDERLAHLSETGKGYEAIKNSGTIIDAPTREIGDVLRKYNINVDTNGKIITTAESLPMTEPDIKALQNFLDTFHTGEPTMSANAILNARTNLSNMSAFERGKSNASTTMAKELRSAIDKAAKTQLPELASLDAKYAPERKLLDNVKRSIFDKTGEIKPNAISTITNLTGNGKEQLLAKIEKIVPGITKDVNILKSIQDITAAGEQKVGTYTRSALGAGGGALAGGPVGAVIGMIVTSPSVGISILRNYGKLKNFGGSVVDGMIKKMESGKKLVGNEVKIMNEAVDNAAKKLESRVKNTRPGMNIQDVNTMTPEQLKKTFPKPTGGEIKLSSTKPQLRRLAEEAQTRSQIQAQQDLIDRNKGSKPFQEKIQKALNIAKKFNSFDEFQKAYPNERIGQLKKIFMDSRK